MKHRKMTQSNQLRDQGVPALGSFEDPKSKVPNNPVGFYNPDKSKYQQIWTQYDLNQCVSRYVWKNLPNGLTSWNLERMLYFRGTLAGFMFAGRFYILPYVQSPNINPYGLPSAIKPITYNGMAIGGNDRMFKDNFELPVDVLGDETENYSAVLLYDSVPYSATGQSPSRFYLNQIIIKEIANTFARVNINIVVSNKKILIQCKDPKQTNVIQKELELAFGSDCPFAIITSPLESSSIQSSNDYNADDLFNTIKNYDAIRCFMSGISSKGFGAEKKERLVTGELAGAEEEKDLILDMGLSFRQLFCDQCNKKFGTNMIVRKRADDYKQEVNGQGQTIEEEAVIGNE